MISSRSRLLRFAPLLLAPALASCVWLLDFDDLQSETDDSGGAAGKGGGSTGGRAGSGAVGGVGAVAGMAGSDACPSECMDDDPCTLDGCTTDGDCTSEPVTGLALDGVDETILADVHGRTTIASASDAFFLSSLAVDGNASEVTFYRLDANATSDALETIATVGSLELGDAVPLSPAGLAVDTALGRIHAFIGMDTPGDAQRVWHVVFDMTYAVRSRTTIAETYWGDSPYHYPVAANFGGDIAAAWINADREVRLWTGAIAGPAALGVGRTAMTVSLLASAENDPLVLYGVEGGGVFVEGPMAPVAGVNECEVRPGDYLSSSATSIGLPGFWLAYWTKYGEATSGQEGYLTTDGRGLVCSAIGCGTGIEGDCGNVVGNAQRNVAATTALLPGDPTGLVHLVQVTGAVGVSADTQELSAGVFVNASRIDFGSTPFEGEPETTDLGSILLSAMPTELPGLAGPDWPVVAYVPPDRFAIAWTQPAAAAGSELRIQRYRLCTAE